MMTAKLTIPSGFVAVLNEDGIWSSDNQELENILNDDFTLADYPSGPYSGHFPAAEQLWAAQKSFGGTITWPDPLAESTEVVY